MLLNLLPYIAIVSVAAAVPAPSCVGISIAGYCCAGSILNDQCCVGDPNIHAVVDPLVTKCTAGTPVALPSVTIAPRQPSEVFDAQNSCIGIEIGDKCCPGSIFNDLCCVGDPDHDIIINPFVTATCSFGTPIPLTATQFNAPLPTKRAVLLEERGNCIGVSINGVCCPGSVNQDICCVNDNSHAVKLREVDARSIGFTIGTGSCTAGTPVTLNVPNFSIIVGSIQSSSSTATTTGAAAATNAANASNTGTATAAKAAVSSSAATVLSLSGNIKMAGGTLILVGLTL